MEPSLSLDLVSPKSIQGGQTSPIMWLYNSKEDSYWIGLWMGEMVLTRNQDSLEESCFEKNYQRTQILPHRERNLLAPTIGNIFGPGNYCDPWVTDVTFWYLLRLSIFPELIIWSDEIRSASRSLFQWTKELFSLQTTQFTDSQQNIWSGLAPTYRFKQEFFSQLHSQFPAQIEKVHNIIQ